MTDYPKENLEIKKKIEELSRGKTFGCVSIREISKKTHKDPRTVKAHIQIMENYGYGLFIDDKKSLFCTIEGLKKINKKSKLLKI